MAGTDSPSAQTIDDQILTWLLVVDTRIFFLPLFLLLGTDTNKTPKAEEVKSSDSFSEVSTWSNFGY